jgi:hypothetical protein
LLPFTSTLRSGLADYRETVAAFFVSQLEEAVGEKPSGYDSEPWGFDSEAQALAAAGAA